MNNGYVIAPTSNDIQHHGILGQKWGRKNGPPYPLGASDHSAAEKEAGYRKSLSKAKYKEYDNRTKGYGTNVSFKSKELNKSIKNNTKIAKQNAKEAFKDIKRTAKLANSYDKKMAKGEKDKITLKEHIGKEIAEASLDKYYEAIDVTSKKKIDRAVKVSASINISTAYALFGIAGYIPSAVKNQRALNYIKDSEKKFDISNENGKYIRKDSKQYKNEKKKEKDYINYLNNTINDSKKKVPKDVQKYIDNNKSYDLESKAYEYERYLKNPDEWKNRMNRY